MKIQCRLKYDMQKTLATGGTKMKPVALFAFWIAMVMVLSGCQPQKVKKPQETLLPPPEEGVQEQPVAGGLKKTAESETQLAPAEGGATFAEFKQAVSQGDLQESPAPDNIKFISPGEAGEEPGKVFAPVHFALDSYELDIKTQNALKAISVWLLAHPEVCVLIEGHCDERGTEAYNLALGEHRALSVRRFLIASGVAPKRLFTVSYGKTKPVDSGHNETAWAANRRCEFRLSIP